MFRQLLKEISLYSLSTVLARGFSFITVPIFTRILSPSDYGALDILSYVSLLAMLLVGCALDAAVGRYYLVATLEEGERRRIASTALFFNIIVFALLAVALSPAAGFLASRWLDGQVSEGTVQVVLWFIWTQAIFYIITCQLRFMFRARDFALVTIGNVIVSTVAGLVAVVWLDLGVAGVFLGQGFGQLIFSGVSFYLARDCYQFVFDVTLFRKMIRYSLPLVPGGVAFFAMQYVDRYILNEMRGLAEVGIYGMGARIASLLNLFLMGFQGAWMPHVLSNFRGPGAGDRFRRVFEFFVFITMLILVLLSLFGKEILLALTTPEFAMGFVVVPPLVLGAVMASMGNYFAYGIQIAEKNHLRMWLNLGALVVSISLNVLLIPIFGALGAALANALCFTAFAVASIAVSQRLYQVPYAWAAPIGALAVGVAVSHSVIAWDAPVSLLLFGGKCVVAVLTAVVLARILKVPLRPSSWRSMVGL